MPFVKNSFFVSEKMPAFLFLIRHLKLSQSDAQRTISKGRVLVDGVSIENSSQELYGDVEVVLFRPQSRGLMPIFENRDFMLFDKPSGVLVHPNKMSTPYSMLDEIRELGGDEANSVHRIDMETSGLLLAAKHKDAQRYLKGTFENREIKKSYLAWVKGKVQQEFEVDQPILKRSDFLTNKHKVKIDKRGQSAFTKFIPLKYDKRRDATLLSCRPKTGRTHQIRIHLFHVKHPILGDPIYGVCFDVANRYLDGRLSQEERIQKSGASRLMLHAQTLEFVYKSRFYLQSRANF